MEKIKKALDHARSLQKTDKISSRHVNALNKVNRVDDLSKIEYTKTRTVKVSKQELLEKRVLLGDDKNAVTDQYKVLRTRVLQRLKANQWRTLAISSPTEGCGKTLTSINLAISLARDVNHSVLLVDLDLRRPSVHKYFYTDEQPGISEFMDGTSNLDELLFNPDIERLVVLPGNKPLANSSEMLSSPRMIKLVDELKSRYPNRIVIFDMPPLLSCDDMIAFSPYVDATMLIVEEGATKKEDLRQSYNLINDKNVIGVVLNKSKKPTSSYSYY